MNFFNAHPPSGNLRDLMTPLDVKKFVGAIEPSKLLDLGSLEWLEKQRESNTKKLAVQSGIQALLQKKETVKDQLIALGKLPPLIQDLITVEFWRENVFPIMLKEGGEEMDMFLLPVLGHEMSIVSLFENVLFHDEAVKALGKASLDLSDYCVRALTQVLAGIGIGDPQETYEEHKRKWKQMTGDKPVLKDLIDSLPFGISIHCISILRFLAENLDELDDEITSRLIISSDTPMLITELLVQKPWRKEWRKSGKVDKVVEFEAEGGWKEIAPRARMIIGKTETQAWLCLHRFFTQNKLISAYEFHDSNRINSLMKLRPFLNEKSLAQLPFLRELKTFINQFSASSGPSVLARIFSSIVVSRRIANLPDVAPPIKKGLDEMWAKEGDSIVQHFRKELLGGDRSTLNEKVKILASDYVMNDFAVVCPTPQNCASCGKTAERKCSRCKEVLYCGRDCQVADWKKHRKNCQIKN